MPKIAQPDAAAKGIYLRRRAYWLRHTAEDGQRYFTNLHTRDFAEAVEKAACLRGVVPGGKVGAWDRAIRIYLEDKLAGKRPAHLGGRRLRTFRKATAPRVKSCLKVFASWCAVDSPSKVKIDHLQRYYEQRRKGSEAGARSTLATIQAFLDHMNCLPRRVLFAADRKPEARQQTLPIARANELIALCEDDNLKYVLFCGFHCGLRKGEIQHSRPQWFDLKSRILTIPGKDTTTLKGQRNLWMPKDAEPRKIPFSVAMQSFLKAFFKRERKYCLMSVRGSKTGLYDFRLPYTRFMTSHDHTGFTTHAMRHSWISELCNSGNHSITEIASWSGDTIETIERNYWHKTTKTGSLDSTLEGRRADEEQKAALVKIMESVGKHSDDYVQAQIDAAFEKYFSLLGEKGETLPAWQLMDR